LFPHLYVHIPFCTGKCHYCGFYSVVADDRYLKGAYPAVLACEWSPQVRAMFPETAGHIRTVYIGGGSPDTLGAEGLPRLAAILNAQFPLGEVEEWTVELNPSGVTPEMLDALLRMGATRVSVGVQSFNNDTLRRIGRRHSVQDVVHAVRRVQGLGFNNVGIDLIAGLPDVSDAEWKRTLEQALSLGLTHLSVYALSVEDNTPLARQVADGQCALPNDAAQLDALARAEEMLTGAGFGRYEISNYALPGFACKHNLGIWRGNDFLGLGPSAASRAGRWRWTNPRSLDEALPVKRERLSARDDALERVMFRLRLDEGFDPVAAAADYPVLNGVGDEWEKRLAGLSRQGVVERGGLRWRLTPRGREVCDAVIRAVFA